ncbi:5'-AMP-activated protein kinase catalytic subunit alpha-1-like [Mercenaria mercenaria]|uniref:5'-AMP-activated protein kinase catalytic subunit alpha-1-like n=1 Tax=Mercenaria mercenaria TaxID=6596 RepID=UPI00234F2AC4|nr:5'-AMP-activated protein kinase catalytic subunit alpha-1-like [Mercenaria mercenaria]
METEENCGDYEIIEMIDYGSFGDILKVKSEKNNEIFAMKQIRFRGNFQDDPYIISEIYCLTRLKHRNIIRMSEIIIDVGADEINIIMEYAEKENIERYMCTNENLEFHQKYKIYSQILEGVQFCHSMDIAHRDLTPVNILLTKDLVVKITDFGLAVKCFDDEDKPLLCSDYLGRASYLPPEVLSQKPFLPKPADIWSVGVTLLFILFQTIPFSGFHQDVLEEQMNNAWELFVHTQSEKLNNATLKPAIIDTLRSQLQLDSKLRKDICELIRLWHDVGPKSMFENDVK